MIFVLILIALAAWLSVVVFFVALCSAAGRADRLASAQSAPATANVIDFSAFRQLHDERDIEPAPPASAFG